ncbi:MAG TPA: AAA family ATPase [Pyrinomonadaceae bacterium]
MVIPLNVIVSGIPASGKSTIARALSDALGLEMWDKDEILEDLFNKKGVGDAQWRTTLSRTADEILQERASQSESSVIVSWWRHPASAVASGTSTEWLSDLPGILIEVNCVCDPAIAALRFKSRIRHSGHLDQSKSQVDLVPAFQEHAAQGPLGIGRLVTVNTEGSVKLAAVVSEINSLSTQDQ